MQTLGVSDASNPNPVELPRGFRAQVANVGIKDDTDDFVVVTSDRPCSAAAVFTRSRFAGPSVTLSREHAANGTLQAVVVVSKNANVATGEQGDANALELARGVAAAAEIQAEDVLVASTGVIGRQYPMDKLRAHLGGPLGRSSTDAVEVATAMMTTDTHAKVAHARVERSDATVVGVAKGVGMIEPDMATMLAFVFTDAAVDAERLDGCTRRVVARTFNSLSVDTDTSTSDTAAVLANGAAGPVELDAFESALDEVCTELTRQLARDGEGATKLLVVDVEAARDEDQARRVAKAVVNSPLVKTAVHGADPNWGRVAMAVGKCAEDTDIDQRAVRICFGEAEVYPREIGEQQLADLELYLRGDEVRIGVELGTGAATWRVYGCDLSDGYVRINADYTT